MSVLWMMINIYHPVSSWLNSFRWEHQNNPPPKKSFILLMCWFLVDFFFHPIGKSFTLNKHETVAATPPSPSQHSLIILKFEFNCSNRSHLWVKYFCVSFQRWWNYSEAWIWFPMGINHPWTKTSQRSAVVQGDIRLAASDQRRKKQKKVHVQQISLHFFLFPNMSRYTGNTKPPGHRKHAR